MKWIPINKAKLKFGELYLIVSTAEDRRIIVAELHKSEVSAAGTVHKFMDASNGHEDIYEATHVIKIVWPV